MRQKKIAPLTVIFLSLITVLGYFSIALAQTGKVYLPMIIQANVTTEPPPPEGVNQVLYLCSSFGGNNTFSETSCDDNLIAKKIGFVDEEFTIDLPGDINGRDYGFDLSLGKIGTENRTALLDVILDQDGTLTTLATTSIVVDYDSTDPSYDTILYHASVQGIDPASSAGDAIKFRVRNDGTGGLVLAFGDVIDSRISIPPVVTSTTPKPTATPNGTLLTVPILSQIENNDNDGNYTVSWGTSIGATSYTLQEDDNASFTSHSTVYTGAGATHEMTGQVPGTYYYRVRGENASGESAWSNVQSVDVFPVPILDEIENDDGDGITQSNWESSAVPNMPPFPDVYVLEEDDSVSFTSPIPVYSGPSTSHDVTGQAPGTYYYRVQLLVTSVWSNVQSVDVK